MIVPSQSSASSTIRLINGTSMLPTTPRDEIQAAQGDEDAGEEVLTTLSEKKQKMVFSAATF